MTPDTGLPGSGIAPAGPLLGNLLQVKLNRIHRDVEGWCRQYGKLFRIAFGPFKVLVVADPALITVILRERPGRFRRPSRSAEVALEMSGNLGLFMAEADDWRNQRRMVMQALAPAAVKAYFPSLQKVATRVRPADDPPLAKAARALRRCPGAPRQAPSYFRATVADTSTGSARYCSGNIRFSASTLGKSLNMMYGSLGCKVK